MEEINIGVIGGSGVYNLNNIKTIDEIEINTPFGSPSDKYIIGELNGIKLAFLSRHNRSHKILPSELNNKANIYGFKKLGVKSLIGVSAVGSLKEEIAPSHIVFPDQIIDRTKGRDSSFFGNGIVAHIGFAEPFCHNLNTLFEESAKKLNITYHKNKTYVCMEGPAFSTRAESNFHRSIGGDIIGMTAIPEAKLAREAEICYGIIALSTDYDCWRENEEAVTVEMIVETLHKNSETAKRILVDIIPKLNYKDCTCRHCLDTAIITQKNVWSDKAVKNLDVILKRFI
ncbi:MAG: methylthioadenosine phosphorylase [Spirochaetes bacterium GWD1_27_9]|nr:MAG: methylthioadenosine phosphorylase [Spirochaetes bacterium GWB1_27_13]OHD25322.1 MAG: methylthioadenosine phosphorylase [Spirochaetes bacterium GWC1_27_15]OHD29566.1 MAG: methylthioadenosine phosphorylase [Spirochaetes bacterium GWD1_27_9]